MPQSSVKFSPVERRVHISQFRHLPQVKSRADKSGSQIFFEVSSKKIVAPLKGSWVYPNLILKSKLCQWLCIIFRLSKRFMKDTGGGKRHLSLGYRQNSLPLAPSKYPKSRKNKNVQSLYWLLCKTSLVMMNTWLWHLIDQWHIFC